MDKPSSLNNENNTHPDALASNILGFVVSIFLTLTAYFLVVKHMLTGLALVGSLVGLGLVQTVVQLICFLDLNKGPKPRLNLVMFLFSALVVLILVLGSLWIMYNLSYRMMPKMDQL